MSLPCGCCEPSNVALQHVYRHPGEQALLLFRRPLGGTALGILGGCFLGGPARLVGALVGGRFGLVVVRHGRHFGGWFAG